MRFTLAVVATAVSFAFAGCLPVGFWGDDVGAEGEGEGDVGEGEGEGEGEGPLLELPPAPDFASTSTDALEIESFALNAAGIGSFLLEDPFVGAGSARRLLYGVDAGASFTQELVEPDVNGSSSGFSLVVDSQGRSVMWIQASRSVGIAVHKGPQDWQGDDAFSAFDPSFVSSADVVARKTGGFVAIVATAINTDSSTDPNCSFNTSCRDYSLTLVEGDVGDWHETSIATHMGDGLGVVRAGVDGDDNPVLLWELGGQIFVGTKNSDGEVVPQVVAAGISSFASFAVAKNGDVHIVGQELGTIDMKHVFSTPDGFLTETLPSLGGYIASIDADARGTVHMATVARTDAGGAEIHYVRKNGDLFDDVVATTIDGIDPTLVGVYPILKLGIDGPHMIVFGANTYVKPQ